MEGDGTGTSSKSVLLWLFGGLVGVLLLLAAFVWWSTSQDAGRRPLKLVIDPTMNEAGAQNAWCTNIRSDDQSHRALGIEVQRTDANTTHVALSPTSACGLRIDFWITRSPEQGLNVEGTSASVASDGSTVPVCNLVGTLRLSRSELVPNGTEPFYLAFDLNGDSAGSDAPHNGFYEIPASAFR